MVWIADDFGDVGPATAPTGITASEIVAYDTALDTPPGSRTAAEAAVVAAVEAKLSTISSKWNSTQQAIDNEILERSSLLQKQMSDVVRQYSLPRQSVPQAEMFSVVTTAMLDRDRLLLELRQRLNASPY